MAEGTQDNNAYGRSDDPAVDAAEHLAAAIGTPAWTEARERMIGLLPDDDPQASERIDAWATDAARHEGDDLTRFLTRSLPQWQQRISAALADDPERAEEARRFADSVRSLLPPPDDTTTQIAMATGHGTVNSVQNGNIYYEVVLGLAPRPRKTTLGKTAAITLGAGAVSTAGGLAATDRLAAEAVKEAGAGHLPGAPLADPAQASANAAQTVGSPSAAGASTPGAAAAGQSGTTVLAKAGAALAKAVTFGGAGAAGVSVPIWVAVGTVAVVVVTTVTIVVPRITGGASCDAAVGHRSVPAVLAEAARRVELTSFRYDVIRGRRHVVGAANPQARTAWFRQGVRGGTRTSGTIDRGKVVLPPGVTTPSGTDRRWVRADGAFIDAVDPAHPARELRSVTRARRDGCTFTGTLAPAAAPAASVEPAVARSSATSAEPVAATSTPTADAPPVDFTARIDDRGRLVRLTTEASRDRLPVAARYWDFGLAVTASAPPSSDVPTSSSETQTLAGKWTGGWSTSLGSGGFTATLAQDGSRITGDLTVGGVPCSLDGSVTGTLDGDRITFGSVNSAGKISFTGSVDGNTMRGSFETDCYDTSGSWTALRSGS